MIVFDHGSMKALREVMGMTQVEFARKIERQPQQVAMWEAGINQPNLDNLTHICNKCDVPVAFFFSEVHSTVEEKAAA